MTQDIPTPKEVSNSFLLRPREWLVVGPLLVIGALLLPGAWERIEPLDNSHDRRMPYDLGNDYWLYGRLCQAAAVSDATLVVGDSVVWGHYVDEHHTLPAALSTLAGRQGFANLGVDGIHPAALAGLIDHYGQAISGKNVLLHCNLLWMSSKRHDLQTDKEFSFNHPALVPQFRPWIRCYSAPVADRLAIVIRRRSDFLSWVNHLRLAYFDQMDVPRWTLEHPRSNPAARISLELPSSAAAPVPAGAAAAWTDKHIATFSPEWVDLATSIQWGQFQRAVAVLRERNNRLFVLVGPFNEHMLEPASRQVYQRMKRQVAVWLSSQGIAHYVPDALPSDYYADASHPLAEGYTMLARQLLAEESFVRFTGPHQAGLKGGSR